MERDVIGTGAEIVKRDELGPHGGGDLLGDERVVREHEHAKGACPVRHFLSDPPETHHPERLPPEFCAGEALLVPDAPFHGGVCGADRPGQRQHECPCVFRHTHAVGARRVHDDDAAIGGGGDVNVVDACAGTGDYPKTRCGSDECGIHLRGAANDERVGVRQIPGQFGGGALRACVDRPAGHASKYVNG